ncbi:MAG TPA: ABC transporter ATP-binding protein [Gaiellaceae bacterium]
MASAVPAVSMVGITKRFPGVVANDQVDFEAASGEVHALLGENGAGKTTLSHILTGLYRADEGTISLYGKPVAFTSPREAIDNGVGMVHQQFRLVSRFTVAENLMLGDRRGAGRHFRIDPGAVDTQVRDLGERYSLGVDPRARIWQLSVGEQQRVEILKALYQEARVLILDEPTAVLTPREADSLFATLRQIAGEGRTVIFISHKLHEVMAVSDRVTVLRAGKALATVQTTDATAQSLATLMVGRDIKPVTREGQARPDSPPVLEVEDLWAEGDRGITAVKGVSLTVRAGEIAAVAGVSGNGQRELAEAITGLRPYTKGSIRVKGKPVRAGDARSAFEAGVGYVPEDRLGTGVAPSLSIAMNLALKSFRNNCRGPFLRLGPMRTNAEHEISTFEIKASGPDQQTDYLSGGNLQKVVIAREFSASPSVLVAGSPTRGLDVSAVEQVHSFLLRAAENGTAVLLISEDLDEILALHDRIFVMYEGGLSEMPPGASVDEIGLRMAGQAAGAPPA